LATTCPRCGTPREGTVRFCTNCALDYWRVAAGTDGPPAQAPAHSEPPQAPPARNESMSPLLVVGLGAVLLVAAGALGVVALSGRESPAVAHDGSATPAASAEPTTPSGHALIRAFFRQARSPEAAFAVRGAGTVTIEGLPEPIPAIEVKTNGEVHGGDFSGTIGIVQGGETIVSGEVRRVGNVAYARIGDDWERGVLPRSDIQPVNPFARITTAGEVSYVGTATVDGADAAHLQVTKWLGGLDFDDLLVGIAIVDQQSTLDIRVDPNGVPLEADLVMEVRASDGVDSATIRVTTEYRFSAWGQVEPIQAPD
jgi:hypothetical protein